MRVVVKANVPLEFLVSQLRRLGATIVPEDASPPDSETIDLDPERVCENCRYWRFSQKWNWGRGGYVCALYSVACTTSLRHPLFVGKRDSEDKPR